MAQPALDIGISTEADGSVVIDLNSSRKTGEETKPPPDDHEVNLADYLPDAALTSIEAELHEGIDADIASRQRWVQNYNEGIQLLGMLLERPGELANNTTTVRHWMLSWAIVTFQALANGEMLPARGPCKVENDGPLPNDIAEALERDINHYLKTKFKAYYPDTDRGLYYLGYGGTIFKKVYPCPLRKMPVSETVYLPDLIISNEAVTIEDARRVTHQVEGFSTNKIRQMIDSGWWADKPILNPVLNPSTTRTAQNAALGLAASPSLQRDYPHTMYECYTWLDLGRWGEEFRETDQDPDLELPYVVTSDRDTRQVYRISRGWRKGGNRNQHIKRFIKWGLVPGFGYLDQGYLNLLGNTDMAATALLRILVDSGIFSNFPGGVRVKGIRLDTNEIRPGPGEFPEIETGGLPINQAIMALPFKGPTAEVLALLQHVESSAEKMVGASNMQTKEGIKDIPVGTMMAAIEMNAVPQIAVHKRLHNGQKEELMALRDELVATPDALALLKNGDEEQPYTAEQLGAASLIPASDPEMPAHLHRFMQATALEMLATQHPEMYDAYEVQAEVHRMAHINGEITKRVLRRPQPTAPQPDPTTLQLMMLKDIEEKKLALKKEDQDGRRALDEMAAKVKAHFQQQELDLKREKQETETSLAAAQDQEHTEAQRDAETLRLAQEQEAADKDRVQALTEAEMKIDSQEAVAAMHDQTTLIVEGIRADKEPTEDKPARDKKSGP